MLVIIELFTTPLPVLCTLPRPELLMLYTPIFRELLPVSDMTLAAAEYRMQASAGFDDIVTALLDPVNDILARDPLGPNQSVIGPSVLSK
jgi:hypothetical protein